MQWSRFIFLLLLALVSLCVVGGSTHLSPGEKLKLHKEWLERRRAQLKSQPPKEATTTDKSTYFRRIIKFKSEGEPEQNPAISFMPNQSLEDNASTEDNKNYKYDLITSPEDQEGHKHQPPPIIVTNQIPSLTGDYELKPQVKSSTDSEGNQSTTTATYEVMSTTDSSPRSTIDPTAESFTERPQSFKKIRKPSSLWNDVNRHPLTLPKEDVTPSPPPTTTTTSVPPTHPSTTTSTTSTLPVATDVSATTAMPTLAKKSSRRAVWSTWSEWSHCSRSCGGGVRSQERTCRSRLDQNATSSDCIGFYKRYRICNDQPCAGSGQGFREQQCSHFDNHTFKAKQYTWEPFIKPDAECELNCKPIRLNYFATLNRTVIDGTPCAKPPYRRNYEGRAVCVEGTCKAVHSSGVIVGAYMNNGAVRCGALVCRPVSGIFTQPKLSNGYHAVTIIPVGASNISITEMKNSLNFLVLKSESGKYVVNGDFTITPSGIYETAGTVFDYKRIDTPPSTSLQKKVEGVTEWITAIGPTTEPLHLMVLMQHHHNPGIKYEYLLPINTSQSPGSDEDETTSAESEAKNLKAGSSPETVNSAPAKTRRHRKFSWKVVKFAPCSKTCGGGIQAPIIKCVREGSTKISPPKKCVNLNKPVVNESHLKCNTQPCPAFWKLYEWSECNCGTDDERSIQTRDVRCVQELTKDRIIQVHDAACVAETPDVDQACDCPTKPVSHIHKGHEAQSPTKPSNRPSSIIRHPSRNHNGTSVHRRPKKAGAWLMSQWMDQCSTECGTGVQYRSIFCDRSPPNSDRCDQRFTPDTSRQCSSEQKCMVGDWFTGPWSPCTGDCFNLTKVRFVFCIREEAIVNERECAGDKPLETAPCDLADVPECTPKWHTSEWTECTKECNEGTQRRVVKCLEPNIKDKHMTESASCLYTERPVAFRTCNGHKCPEIVTSTTTEYDPQVDLIQNDVVPDCTDEFPNCHLVVKARLCHHSYYKEHCCGTCSNLE